MGVVQKQVTSFWSYLRLPENQFLKFSLGYAGMDNPHVGLDK